MKLIPKLINVKYITYRRLIIIIKRKVAIFKKKKESLRLKK